ncbi:hypothetical protein M441DRAFT_60849 [Trichoderma asperellum CBS 433.97]|uniref:Uncharacterized protein n=1 Tax=Trichoderma asperellum (strain ATCC 204424 / CBS 433.97 / NBRC 101777) TaxID=1042311 RepID=A0A2T3YYN1_TRIA4|nr:hypothetical protein M441DRAFT_60849 [Trichoderma asperellum CBS 433.97]PTB37681.1 hypothetical protein M441DRAFT_60849 [Trichoderma asperellum CBS 433.97]
MLQLYVAQGVNCILLIRNINITIVFPVQFWSLILGLSVTGTLQTRVYHGPHRIKSRMLRRS